MNQYLEAEAIHIFREVTAEAKNPVFHIQLEKTVPMKVHLILKYT